MNNLIWAPYDPTKYFCAPVKHHGGDAGYDLTTSQGLTVAPRAFAQIPTNIKVALPESTWAMVVSRSSTFYRRNLISNTAIIDNGWRGALFGVVWNPMDKPVYIKKGERLVQLIVFNLVHTELAQVPTGHDFPLGERGEAGFGSTGGFVAMGVAPGTV